MPKVLAIRTWTRDSIHEFVHGFIVNVRLFSVKNFFVFFADACESSMCKRSLFSLASFRSAPRRSSQNAITDHILSGALVVLFLLSKWRHVFGSGGRSFGFSLLFFLALLWVMCESFSFESSNRFVPVQPLSNVTDNFLYFGQKRSQNVSTKIKWSVSRRSKAPRHVY